MGTRKPAASKTSWSLPMFKPRTSPRNISREPGGHTSPSYAVPRPSAYRDEAATTSSNHDAAITLATCGKLPAVRERWKVPLVVASSPPTMSMWTPPTRRATTSGCRAR